MRIFITGHHGFIGRETARHARLKGHEVMGLEKPFRMENPPWSLLEKFRPEVCVHTAWIATPGVYINSPLNESHRIWGRELAVGLAGLGMRHLVALGTCAEYAPSFSPLHEENSPLGRSSPYANAKAAFHDDLSEIALGNGFTLSWARIFYPYGPGEHPQRLISSLIRGFAENKPARIQAPEAVRDYIHVEDVSSALLLLAEQKVHGTVNVGTGHGIRLGDLESMIARLMGISFQSAPSLFSRSAADSVVADIGRMKALGWTPRHGHVESGLQTYSALSPQSPIQ